MQDNAIVNETIIALQSIINRRCLQASSDSEQLLKTRKVVIVHCAKRLQQTSNSYAKSMMIHLMSKQVAEFPVLALETLRRLIVTFCDQKSSAVKCQILNLGLNVYHNN